MSDAFTVLLREADENYSRACTLCGETQPIESFHLSDRGRRHSHCRECRVKANREREARSRRWGKNLLNAKVTQ